MCRSWVKGWPKTMNGRVCSFDEWTFAPAPFTIIIIFFQRLYTFFCKFTTVWSACVQFQKRSRKHRLIILTGVCTNACYLTYVCTNMPNKTPFYGGVQDPTCICVPGGDYRLDQDPFWYLMSCFGMLARVFLFFFFWFVIDLIKWKGCNKLSLH